MLHEKVGKNARNAIARLPELRVDEQNRLKSAEMEASGDASMCFPVAMISSQSTKETVVDDLRTALPRRDPRAHSLDFLLNSKNIAWSCADFGALVGLREVRRALRFDSELQLTVVFHPTYSAWIVRVSRQGSQQFADLIRSRGGIRRWKNIASTMRFLRRNFSDVSQVSVVMTEYRPLGGKR